MTQSEVRIGVIGTGGWANTVHMRGYQAHPKARIVGVCDIILDRAKEAAEKFGAEFATDDYMALINRDDIDAIDVVTPNNVHVPIAMAAVKAGKHVMCEKPLAMNVAEAKELVDAAKAAGVKTGVNFTYRGHPAARYAREVICSGEIGRIFHVNAFYMQSWLVDPQRPLVWRLQKNLTGTGVLGDLASHVIDLAEWFTGSRITSVVGDMSTFQDERPLPDGSGTGKVDVDDAGSFLARYDNGAMGVFVSSRYGTGWTQYQRIEVYGEKGGLIYRWSDVDSIEVSLGDNAKESKWVKAPVPDRFSPRDGDFRLAGGVGAMAGWTEMVSDFIDAIIEDKEMVPNFQDGLNNQAVLDAVVDSVDNRSWAKVQIQGR